MAEIARSRRERPGSLAVYDLYLQALAKVATETAADNADALAVLTDGRALEPDNAVCLAHAAWALQKRATIAGRPSGPTTVSGARRWRAGGSRTPPGSNGDGEMRYHPD